MIDMQPLPVIRRWNGIHSLALAASILVAVGALAACNGEQKSDPAAPTEKDWESAIDERRAFEDLKAFAEIGGVSHALGNSQKLDSGRKMIIGRLEAAGLKVRKQSFPQWVPTNKAGTDARILMMQNIIGVIPGQRPEAIAIACHYDIKAIPNKTFVGANDGGSGVALTLELARKLSEKYASAEAGRPPFTLKFVFFDGEEAMHDWHLVFKGEKAEKDVEYHDNCYGSRYMAARNDQEKIETLILLDMVGDTNLELVNETGSDANLRRIFEEASRDVFGISIFGKAKQVLDDHLPFKEAGMRRVIDLIDFEYGRNNEYWHTPADTVDKCSPASLKRVGTLVWHALPQVEEWLSHQLD